MRVAIISDIHGNFEALNAVIEDLLPRKVDRIISLGDNIGYGPDSEKVTQMVYQLGVSSVVGNHELALFDEDAFDGLNFQAQENNLSIKEVLSDESIEYCKQLPIFIQLDKMYFVHGFPPDQVNGYLFEVSDKKIDHYFSVTQNQICFVGHTHLLSLVSWDGTEASRQKISKGHYKLDKEKKYIVNAGSVGQPRDKNHSSKYVIWDDEKYDLEVVYVSYDSTPTREKIRELGFPEVYAKRLK